MGNLFRNEDPRQCLLQKTVLQLLLQLWLFVCLESDLSPFKNITHADEETGDSSIGFPHLLCTLVSSGSERISSYPPMLACGIVIGYLNKREGTAASG